jgi:hypothetical protein
MASVGSAELEGDAGVATPNLRSSIEQAKIAKHPASAQRGYGNGRLILLRLVTDPPSTF